MSPLGYLANATFEQPGFSQYKRRTFSAMRTGRATIERRVGERADIAAAQPFAGDATTPAPNGTIVTRVSLDDRDGDCPVDRGDRHPGQMR